MKLFQIILLVFLPLSLLSQETEKFEIADTIFTIHEYLKKNFNDEIVEKYGNLKNERLRFQIGIFNSENILEKDEWDKYREAEKLPTLCRCGIGLNKVIIGIGMGFYPTGGTVNAIEIHLEDSTYFSQISYYTDGFPMHKFKEEEDFFEDITVGIENSRLEISPDSEFKIGGIIKGRLTGISAKYYEVNDSAKGYKKVQSKVESIFKCKLSDDKERIELFQKMKERQMKENKN